MKIGKLIVALLMGAASAAAGAQAVPSATARNFSLVAGAMASGFRPDYETGYPLFGPGAYVDFRLSHWVQIEAEGRWLRFNEFYGEHQDNYLIGPRVPIKQLGKWQFFGKALIGLGKMEFPDGAPYSSGSFTALAFGGTAEYRLNRRWSLRALDFEYQDWPKFVPGRSDQPYGLSVGVGYRIF